MKKIALPFISIIWLVFILLLFWPNTYLGEVNEKNLSWQLQARAGLIALAVLPIGSWVVVRLIRKIKKRS